jgi:hypothetical protein
VPSFHLRGDGGFCFVTDASILMIEQLQRTVRSVAGKNPFRLRATFGKPRVNLIINLYLR